jgi:hypothetical protein
MEESPKTQLIVDFMEDLLSSLRDKGLPYIRGYDIEITSDKINVYIDSPNPLYTLVDENPPKD